MNQKSYEASHLILGLIEIIAWLSAVSGAIIGLLTIGDVDAILPPSLWFGFAFSSIGLAALCRVGKAILDIAENTGRAVQLLATPPLPHTPHNEVAALLAADSTSNDRAWPMGPIEVFRGYQIVGLRTKVSADGQMFDSVEAAKQYLLGLPEKLT